MKVHKLNLEDLEEDFFALFAIHTELEEYKLAYNLNRYLGLHLKRCNKDLDFNYLHASFSIFDWRDDKQDINWVLISNKCQSEIPRTVSSGTLSFEDTETETITTFLIPEQKKSDYILKVEGIEEESTEMDVLRKIQQIPAIQTCYTLEIDKLKSIKNLITA